MDNGFGGHAVSIGCCLMFDAVDVEMNVPTDTCIRIVTVLIVVCLLSQQSGDG